MAEKLKPGLTAEHVIHPLDRQSIQAVMDKAAGVLGRAVFDRLMREADEDFYLVNLADNTKLSPTQGGSLYRLVEEVAGVLGMPTPHVFLDTSPTYKPRTMGGAHATVVIPSALVDALPDTALRAVIGHELGYIVCGHSFYRLLAGEYDAVLADRRAVAAAATDSGDGLIGRASGLVKGVGGRIGGLFQKEKDRPPIEPADD